MGSSSLTKDWTWAPCIGTTESHPLDHQGSPKSPLFFNFLIYSFRVSWCTYKHIWISFLFISFKKIPKLVYGTHCSTLGFFFLFFSFLSLDSISWRFFHISTKRTSSFFFTAAHIRKNFLTIRACFKIELCHWEHSGEEQTGMMELRFMCQRGSQARRRLLFFQLRFPDPVC